MSAEKLKTLMGKIAHLKKTAYLPTTESVKASFSPQSKIGGLPYLRNEEDWPICPNCKKHKQLFLQLNLSQLPEQQDKGLVQLFYCTSYKPHCESDLSAFFPDSDAVTCRKIQIDGKSATIEPKIDELFEEKSITGWKPKDDYPHPEELYGMDIELTDEEMDLIFENNVNLTGDKLFGYPFWVQSIEYPEDANGELMELLFQLDSEVNLPYMFGDSGIGHLSKSKQNADDMGFGWACY